MTCFDTVRLQAERVVSTLRVLLSEPAMARRIDDPIDRAVKGFRFVWSQPFSHRAFQQIIGEFVEHVYRCGLPCPRILTSSQACDEAVAILERGYRNNENIEYDGALVAAAADPKHGIDQVLAGMSDIIKAQRREAYTAWAYARHIPPFDPGIRCAIAEVLRERCRTFLGAAWLECPSVLLASHIPALFDIDICTDRDVRQVAAHAFCHSL